MQLVYAFFLAGCWISTASKDLQYTWTINRFTWRQPRPLGGAPPPVFIVNHYTTRIFLPPIPWVEKMRCDPYAAPPCASEANTSEPLTYCLTDPDYPEAQIQDLMEKDRLFLFKYADVPDQSGETLVDGKEDDFDYGNYTGQPYDRTKWISASDGFVCPSRVVYGRPVRAANVRGQWRVVVQNVGRVTQTQRLETCLEAGGSCRAVDPCYRSQCLQKYVHHRLLSFDPCDSRRGLFVDEFKMPSACSCHIPK